MPMSKFQPSKINLIWGKYQNTQGCVWLCCVRSPFPVLLGIIRKWGKMAQWQPSPTPEILVNSSSQLVLLFHKFFSPCPTQNNINNLDIIQNILFDSEKVLRFIRNTKVSCHSLYWKLLIPQIIWCYSSKSKGQIFCHLYIRLFI